MRFLITIVLLYTQGLRASPIWLKVGEVRSLPASPEAVIRVGQRGVIRVIEEDHSIRLIGLKPGHTSLVIDSMSHTVVVARSSQKDFVMALKDELSRMKGLRLVTDTQPVEIVGTLLRFSDWKRLAMLARKFQGEYVFRAQALPDVAEVALPYFQNLAKTRGLPVLRFSAEPRFAVHVPSVSKSKGLETAAVNAFRDYGISVQAAPSDLHIEPLVRTQVILAELSRGRTREFGVEWPTSYQAQLLPKMEANQQLLVSLKALESNGQAQILASPNLLCRSGGEARFHAGGEFPIRLISRQTRDVHWKQHGVLLKVKPKADFQGAMSIEVETEVSLLDMANAVDGIPALKTNRVKSHFDLPGKRTIALSGLIKQSLGDSKEGLPLLSSLPVLGPLFSSRKFLAEQSELVIFVTPEIHSPETETQIEMPKGWVTHEW